MVRRQWSPRGVAPPPRSALPRERSPRLTGFLRAAPAGQQQPPPQELPRPPWPQPLGSLRRDSWKSAGGDGRFSFPRAEMALWIVRQRRFPRGVGSRPEPRVFPSRLGESLRSEGRWMRLQPELWDRSWLSPEPPDGDRGTSGFWSEHCSCRPRAGFRPRREWTPPVLRKAPPFLCHRRSNSRCSRRSSGPWSIGAACFRRHPPTGGRSSGIRSRSH